ncbi:MAG: hypothetical protein Q9167_007607 [Letrouitia subvulpina]
MGQSVSALVESIENNAQKEKLANDALNSLVELAVRRQNPRQEHSKVNRVVENANPTKLSDATLRNIVQNTYSASNKEEQLKMYNQLKAARDADLKPSHETSSVTFSSAVKALNNYTVPSMRAIAAPRKAYVKYKLYKQVFTASFEMNTAHAYKDELQAWINGALAISLGEAVDEIAVQVEVEPNSTSDSVLEGEASISIASTFPSPQYALNKSLKECLEKVVRTELSQVLARSYTIGNVSTVGEDTGALDGMSGMNGELTESDDGFSNVEEVASSSRPKQVTKGRIPTTLVHANVL